MEQILNITGSFWFQSILKITLGFILAGIIGLERSSWNKPAGFRTHSLVGMSAVLIMLCGEYMISKDTNTVLAQIENIFNDFNVDIKHIKRPKKDEIESNTEVVTIVGQYAKKGFKKNELLRNISSLENVNEIMEE